MSKMSTAISTLAPRNKEMDERRQEKARAKFDSKKNEKKDIEDGQLAMQQASELGSVLLTADSSTLSTLSTEIDEPGRPLSMRWTYGFNTKMPVLNLNDGKRNKAVVYASSHVVVIYDYALHKQTILEGHMNKVKHICCNGDRRWLVTADSGSQCCIIIWDTFTGIPVQTLFDVVEEGGAINSVTISWDAKFVAVITESKRHRPKFQIWDWTESNEPIVSQELKSDYRGQCKLRFHPTDNNLMVSNSESQVIFYSWVKGEVKFDAPVLNDSTFKKSVGVFVSTMFQMPPHDLALTATSTGLVAVWTTTRAMERKGVLRSYRRRVKKLNQLSTKAITLLTQTAEGIIISGDVTGQVKFYDCNLSLLYWLVNVKLGGIASMSFDICKDHLMLGIADTNLSYPDDATIEHSRFVCATCTISTHTGQLINYVPNGLKVTHIKCESNSPYDTISASPNQPLLCIGSKAGLLKVVDYNEKQSIATRVFPKNDEIHSVSFNHDSSLIAVGLLSGTIVIVDPISLATDSTFQVSGQAISKIKFSHNSKYMATADLGFAVTVFINQKDGNWKCIGRYKSHYDVINDIVFGVDEETDTCRLLTVGNDRNLVEYDLAGMEDDNYIHLKSIHRIEQSALPLSLECMPPVMTESFLITSNSQYKLKLYNATTKMCRYTFLAPVFGSPVSKIKVVPVLEGEDPSKDRLLCYATDTKIGIQMLPLDGSPHRSVAIIGHADGIAQIECSYDGKYVFAAGAKSSSVHMWAINRSALEAASLLGGEDLEPFYSLLNGGKDGELINEIENFFYYSQIKTQGENTRNVRNASNCIDLEQVPFMMRALGFYPSEQEIEDMQNEVKFKNYLKTSKYVNQIDLPDFIKLYINHRPAFGLSVDELTNSFRTLCSGSDTCETVNRNYLFQVLQHLGEHLTHEELAECLYSLLGKEIVEKIETYNSDELLQNEDTDNSTDITDPAHFMPDQLSVNYFVTHLLGLNANNNPQGSDDCEV